MLTGADPQEGWPLPAAVFTPERAMPGIEALAVPRGVQLAPVIDTWDRAAALAHVVRNERLREASVRSPWLFVAFLGLAVAAVMSAITYGIAQGRMAR